MEFNRDIANSYLIMSKLIIGYKQQGIIQNTANKRTSSDLHSSPTSLTDCVNLRKLICIPNSLTIT